MDARVTTDRSRRRRHPARGARSVALAASVASTAGLAAWIAYGEGAFEAASSPEAEAETEADAGAGANVPGLPTDLVPRPSSTTIAPPTTSEGLPTAPVDADDDVLADDDLAADDDLLAEETLPDDVFTTAPAAGVADGVFAGTAEYTEWGDVQVQVTIVDGLIVDVEAIEIPEGRRSTRINDRAAPILEADAIASQTATSTSCRGRPTRV